MIPTIAKRWINSFDVKVFFRVKREKLNLNRSTWEIRRSSEKYIMLFDFESLHLLQSYIQSFNFPRDEEEKLQKMLIFVLGAVPH